MHEADKQHEVVNIVGISLAAACTFHFFFYLIQQVKGYFSNGALEYTKTEITGIYLEVALESAPLVHRLANKGAVRPDIRPTCSGACRPEMCASAYMASSP